MMIAMERRQFFESSVLKLRRVPVAVPLPPPRLVLELKQWPERKRGQV